MKMKKLLIAFVGIATCAVMAGPRGCGGCGGNSGVRLATDIVNLVGASLDILAPRTAVVATTPVVTTPVVAAPVVATPVLYPCYRSYYSPCHRPCRPCPPPPCHRGGGRGGCGGGGRGGCGGGGRCR